MPPQENDPNGKLPSEPGAKLDQGKVYASLLGDFGRALMAVAENSTMGAQKYSRGGWQSVPDGITRYRDAAWRHLLKRSKEEFDSDPDTVQRGYKIRHLTATIWNLLAELELTLRAEDPRLP